jgi:hypothetical protein
MQLSMRKIDERIQKLQEIKRIAADPELVSMLFEFIGDEDGDRADPASKSEAATGTNADDVELVNKILKGTDAPANGIWNRKGA